MEMGKLLWVMGPAGKDVIGVSRAVTRSVVVGAGTQGVVVFVGGAWWKK